MSNIITNALFDLLTNIPGAGEGSISQVYMVAKKKDTSAFSEARVKTENSSKPTA